MSIALYMDEHIHLAITVGLQFRDVDVLTVQDDGRTGMPDTIILDRAAELQRVVFTQDEDFLAIANRRQQEGINLKPEIARSPVRDIISSISLAIFRPGQTY
ncbi:DUF5615 family PIN-like protein [Microcoleus sp. PH2017_02_FOX_O_A]|uniref:DUF5615 family PIN-like protein n=1 Tax=Microcoleus sp. PH2017_02_FOX_O_A TaxID=2798813 RepID=UPI001D9B8A76|nr:DUF5615 family PIN-like protein [Microcoleus sp. PH2017_02_FOX_O_A]MCC3415877.1 DUF5615 family PIN-like protein [Microcoleus sp. PH2017_02_FOX_O_A]